MLMELAPCSPCRNSTPASPSNQSKLLQPCRPSNHSGMLIDYPGQCPLRPLPSLRRQQRAIVIFVFWRPPRELSTMEVCSFLQIMRGSVAHTCCDFRTLAQLHSGGKSDTNSNASDPVKRASFPDRSIEEQPA